jgi:LPS export ABC transporter protein LptC
MIQIPCFCKHNKMVLLSFSVLIFLIFVVTFEPNLNLAPPKEEGLPDFSFEDVLITEIDEGVVTWQVHASKASLFDSDNHIKLEQSVGDVFEGERKIVSFKSPLGTYSLESALLHLEEAESDVYFENRDVNVNAGTMEWDFNRREMSGEGIVLVESEFMSLAGEALSVDYETNTIKLFGNVNAMIRTEEPL